MYLYEAFLSQTYLTNMCFSYVRIIMISFCDGENAISFFFKSFSVAFLISFPSYLIRLEWVLRRVLSDYVYHLLRTTVSLSTYLSSAALFSWNDFWEPVRGRCYSHCMINHGVEVFIPLQQLCKFEIQFWNLLNCNPEDSITHITFQPLLLVRPYEFRFMVRREG